MYDNWKKSNQKMILLMVCVLLSAAALFSVFFFDLFPLADELAKGSSVTPADMQIHCIADMETAAKAIHRMGCKAVVVKGGHAIGIIFTVFTNMACLDSTMGVGQYEI